MLKHVAVSPHRSRADSVSLSSAVSFCSTSGSSTSHPPPPPSESLHSRSSSYSSLSDASAVTTTIKVYARCLRPDIEYKTLSVTFGTTARDVVALLLSKYKMRHRDPKLFYLTMEVTMRQAGVRTVLVLDDSTKPAALQSCHPKGYSKFSLQMRRGGLVKIYDSALMSSSQYKSLLISERTTADELLAILLNCYSSAEKVEQFSLYEVCKTQEYQRKLHPDDLPLRVQQSWQASDRQNCHFLVRRNPDYRPLTRRKQMMWTPDLQTSTKELPSLSSLQETLQSFSSLTLSDTPFSENVQGSSQKGQTYDKVHNKSVDSVLNANCERWGNYINFKRGEMNVPNAEKLNIFECDQNQIGCDGCSSQLPIKSNITPSKSCHQIGCYSPVYRYPSINYCSTNHDCNSFDSSSLSSTDSGDIVTSTPIQSPIMPNNISASNLFFSSGNPIARLNKSAPAAAPRIKLQHSHVDYENYFCI